MMILDCPKCGFTIETKKETTPRQLIKIIREHLITASLWGCQECVKKLKKLRGKYE